MNYLNEVVEVLTKKAKAKYYSYRVGAKRRGLTFDLTFNQFREITSEECVYCGKQSLYNKETKEFNLNGVDRIDNTKGYHLLNSRACCSTCNYMKSDLGEYEFVGHLSKIYHNLKLFTLYNQDTTCTFKEEK